MFPQPLLPLSHGNTDFKEVSDFDFYKIDALPNADLHAFRKVQEAFAEGFSTELSSYFRREFSISLNDIRQMTWKSYAAHFSAPTCLMVLRAQTTAGIGTLEIAPSFVFTVLEIILGGKADTIPDTSRELTSIEKRLLGVFFRNAQRCLQTAWSVDGPDFAIQSVESGPAGVAGVSADDPMLVAEFLVRADGVDGYMALAAPARFVRQRRPTSDTSTKLAPKSCLPGHTNQMLKRLQPGLVKVDTKLMHTTLRIGDLAALEPGDLLNLGYPISSPLSLCVNGSEIYSGFIVPAGGKRAFSIENAKPVNSETIR